MTAIATATMRGEAVDIRKLPGWETAPRVWRTVGPGMRVRVISPEWVAQAAGRKEIADASEAIASTVSRETRMAQIAEDTASRHGIPFTALFQSTQYQTPASRARHEAWTKMRSECIAIKAIAQFFVTSPKTIRDGISVYKRRHGI